MQATSGVRGMTVSNLRERAEQRDLHSEAKGRQARSPAANYLMLIAGVAACDEGPSVRCRILGPFRRQAEARFIGDSACALGLATRFSVFRASTVDAVDPSVQPARCHRSIFPDEDGRGGIRRFDDAA